MDKRRPFGRLDQGCPQCGNIPPRSRKLACILCVDAIRTAVKRLKVLLKRIGYAIPQAKRAGTS